MTVTIGWFLNKEPVWNDLVYSMPEPLEITKDNKAQYIRCPALNHYSSNTFVIRSAYDLHLRFDRESKKIKYIDGSVEKYLVKDLLVQFHPQEWRDQNTPIFQLHIDNGFVADEPVWVEVFPPFYNCPNVPGFLTPGTFDIYSWQRTLSYGFEWIDSERDYKIKRGDPLIYVRFRSKRPEDTFTLKKIKMTDQLERDIKKCQGVKMVLKNYSWKLMELNKKLRPKRYVK